MVIDGVLYYDTPKTKGSRRRVPLPSATVRILRDYLAALKFHALRHTYASLCVAAGIPPLELARFMGHAKVTTTLSVYAHLFEDDHADAMALLGAMGTISPPPGENVVPLRQNALRE